MRPMNMKNATFKTQLFLALVVAATLFLTPVSFAAVPGITGAASTPVFNLTAQQGYLNMPDGEAIYSWGYGCDPAHPQTTFAPTLPNQTCPTMQVPGPTLIVHENDTVTVNLLNGLPTAAGNTSLLFPGFQVCIGTITAGVCTPSGAGTNGVAGLLTQEAAPGGTVSYQFVASAPGTHPYYSGTQGDLQVEMGLYGAVIVLPASVPANCDAGYHALNATARSTWGETDFRLAHAAYDHPGSCYDREYLFQWGEMDSRIHRQALAQVQARVGCTANTMGCSLDVQTEPYHPAYFMINGRSMPDLMDPNYASEYPHQPYNGNPHMHPGELTLVRTIGQGRWEHPFHEHANHVRILSRDGNLILSPTVGTCSTSSAAGCVTYSSGLIAGPGKDSPVAAAGLAGILMFNTDTTPGESFDGIFYFTGRGLNWDPFGHHPPSTSTSTLSPFTITAISEVGNTVSVAVAGTLSSTVNNTTVAISNAPGYNGSFTASNVVPGGTFTITSLSETAGGTVTATVTGTLPAVNSTVLVAGSSPAGYNGSFSVISVTPGTTTSTLTYADSNLGLASGTGGTATINASTFTYTDPTTGLASASVGTATVNTGATSANPFPTDPLATLPCTPDVNGYNSGDPTAVNFMEWCQDHNKPVQVNPFGDVASGGPVTLPDPNVFTNGPWYGGTPYFGPDASLRAAGPSCDTTQSANCTPLLPSNNQANPASERGWAFMWHSHNEREITTNNVFPGGMLMMMLVDSREFVIDESQ